MSANIYKCKDEQILKELCSIFGGAHPLHELIDILLDESLLSMDDTIKVISENFGISEKTSEFILNMQIGHFSKLDKEKMDEVYERFNYDRNPKVSQRFFIPYEGKDYKLGIKGKKVFVVGASFYCDKQNCKYFKYCTNPDNKDSSPYNTICPEYMKNGAVLEKEPEYAIDENYPAYQRFAKCMNQFVEPDVNVWHRMAFTNYVQFFVPTVKTERSYLSQRDFDAFIESVIQLQPDVIISWGMVTVDAVRDSNYYVFDREKLKDSEWYICHMKVEEVKHDITLVCCFHPSSPDWNQDFEKLTGYLRKVLEEK